jgi:uroporphyrinogen III methyltransferase/synthase
MMDGGDPITSLAGKRVVVTRATDQAGELIELLRNRGAEPLAYPCIAVAQPEDTASLDAALQAMCAGEFDCLVLTSRNGVTALRARLLALGLDPEGLSRVAVAAVGPATARAVERELGVRAVTVPDEFVAEALAAALAGRLRPGERVLLCQADIARAVLAESLAAAGAAVTSVVAYRTVIGAGGVDLPALLEAGQVDAILLTSASTAHNLRRRLDAESGRHVDLAGVCVACLGPIVAGAAQELGWTVSVLPAEPTLPALLDALETYFAG